MSSKQNSVEIAIRLKDDVSAGLKDIQNNFKGIQESVSSLGGGVSGLGETLGKVPQKGLDNLGSGIASWAGKARNSLDELAKTSLADLDQAFANSGQNLATGKAPEEEGGVPARFEQELEALRDRNRAELEELTRHGSTRAELLQLQSDKEIDIREEQSKQEQSLAESNLAFTEGALNTMFGLSELFYKSGLVQGQGVFKMYQALAVAEATISTYKSAQAAYAQGVTFGGPIMGAVMAATAVAAGMAQVAKIKSTQPRGYAFGGRIGDHSGFISGPDRGERADNVTIRATPGEYMLDRPAVRHYGLPILEALRRRRIPRNVLESFGSPALPVSRTRTAYAFGGEVGTGSLSSSTSPPATGQQDALTIINVMDFQREFDRALASNRGRRVLINILGEEGIG